MKALGLVLLYGLLVLTLIVIWFVPIWLQIALFAGVVVSLLLYFESAGPLHPAAWFSVFLFLYAVHYPLFLLDTKAIYAESLQVLPLHFLALAGFLIGIISTSSKPLQVPRMPIRAGALRVLILLLIPICVGLVIMLLVLGIGSKREYIDTVVSGSFGMLFLSFQIISITYLVYALRLTHSAGAECSLRHSFFTTLGISVFIVLILGFGVTGERDILFRLGLLIYLCLMALKRGPTYRFWHFIVLSFTSVFLVNILQGLKGFLVASSDENPTSRNVSIFLNEFFSAGRNLAYVLSRNIEPVGGETYIWAVERYFRVLFPDTMSATQWFNSVVRVSFGDGGTSGWGFSLVAEAYLNFGAVGIFLFFLFVGLLTSALYSLARRSTFWFIFYLLFIPTLVYVIRADFANFLSLVFKINIFIVGLIWVFGKSLEILARRRDRSPLIWSEVK